MLSGILLPCTARRFPCCVSWIACAMSDIIRACTCLAKAAARAICCAGALDVLTVAAICCDVFANGYPGVVVRPCLV